MIQRITTITKLARKPTASHVAELNSSPFRWSAAHSTSFLHKDDFCTAREAYTSHDARRPWKSNQGNRFSWFPEWPNPTRRAYVERTIQSFKDRIESFDDYFPCRKLRCPLNHVKAWMSLYAFYYNFVRCHETMQKLQSSRSKPQNTRPSQTSSNRNSKP